MESHNRPGGDRINELVEIAYGADIKRMTFISSCATMDPSLGVVREILGVERTQKAAGLAELQLNLKAGDVIRPMTQSHDRVGHVIAQGRDAPEAVRLCEDIVNSIRVITAAPTAPRVGL